MNKKFNIFCDELLKWNKIHNLTGYKSRDLIFENIEDSIYPLSFINDFKSAIDIGSGNGFPAILLAILKQDCKFYLTEPNNKKSAFLNHIAIKLELENVEIIKNRFEELPKFKVDLITSRALFKSDKLIDLSKDFLNNNGYFLFYKGSDEKNVYKKVGNRSYVYKSKGNLNG
ncbi:16S rRNA (guanine(527)-N(7))-methyltransferase RsmG [Helicobacter sp. MIT 99-5507]|uniref:16S rRNA (guanine(527)-N(7))-methyltransferase RsmG n=1 Tax=Helicobacter sp. MIT 99-5507 TaxID=152489 RepID=UPI000E1F5D38|nr:16S rRNA (guanine(527)-N(7))-methyltransferase RsmG [Helicobacter sp. MIT 99-5507]RDU57498.1 16S rRNA (guanine(527)-N(7))-methyltransferase RsmG [Helicobacter sp. MIT 99-5507]